MADRDDIGPEFPSDRDMAGRESGGVSRGEAAWLHQRFEARRRWRDRRRKLLLASRNLGGAALTAFVLQGEIPPWVKTLWARLVALLHEVTG